MNKKQKRVLLIIRCSDERERIDIKNLAHEKRMSVQQLIIGLIRKALGKNEH